ncbi:DUF6600 domain-containing protein [Xylophilus sp. GOD-11R]|uniref:DUF6600 domain-containing protein n=1 Tax=Xylophilus sp. GOD-11R TaxID=3089814 RepID=UPI00298C9291|nr:DUF6600 domain-containing protein [Xylophilus sp. GOD-11R]WPB59052.1 DUF6600 domain-containing protein [Xylophilus sp. GOD-11R]
MLAQAQSFDGPQHIARFEAMEGSVQFQSAADNQMRLADPQWPLAAGDRVQTAAGSRAELNTGGATLRIGESSDMGITALDERTTQLRLTAGTIGVTVRELPSGERFELDTPNLAVVLDRPGRWRVDVDPGRNTTRITAEFGAGTLYGANGQALAFAAPQSREFSQQALAGSAPLALRQGDGFDRWSDERERILTQSPSVRYASADIPGVAQLDAYGDWTNDPRYGAIWYPRSVGSDWAPYRDGRWEWIPPWGWTWVDQSPWGFAPFHYGRWEQAGNRWGWIPGPPRRRPGYAPSLPFAGARPHRPDGYPPGSRPPDIRPMAPQRIGAPIEPLADQVRRDQWERNQRVRQDQHQADMLRQQQMREAQQRFQPSFGQRQLDDQRRQIEQQQQQLMFQQQRQQQDLMRQQQNQQQQSQQQQRQQQFQLDQQRQQQQFNHQQQQQQMLIRQGVQQRSETMRSFPASGGNSPGGNGGGGGGGGSNMRRAPP